MSTGRAWPKKGGGGRQNKKRGRKMGQRFRQKQAQSWTTTDTKKRRTNTYKKEYSDFQGPSNFSLVVGKASGSGKPTVSYRHQQQLIVDTHGSAQQSVVDLYSVVNQRHIALGTVADNASAAEVDLNDWWTNIFGMNPDYNAAGGPLASAETGTTLKKNKLAFLKDIQGTIRLSNFSNNTTEVTLYWCTVKNGSDFANGLGATGRQTTVQQFIDQMIADNAENQLNVGGINQRSLTIAPVGGWAVKEAAGYNPWNDPKFRKNFKMLKKIQTTVKGGFTKKISHRLVYNRWFNYSDWNGAAGSYGQTNSFNVPGCTVYCFAIMRGEPCLVTLTTPATEVISPGPFKMGVEITYTADIGYSEKNTASKRIEYVNYNFAQTADPTKILFINEETDAPVQFDDAGA